MRGSDVTIGIVTYSWLLGLERHQMPEVNVDPMNDLVLSIGKMGEMPKPGNGFSNGLIGNIESPGDR